MSCVQFVCVMTITWLIFDNNVVYFLNLGEKEFFLLFKNYDDITFLYLRLVVEWVKLYPPLLKTNYE